MKLDTNNTQQMNVNVMDGNNQKAFLGASIKPGSDVNINLQIIDTAYAAANADAIATVFAEFLVNVMTAAKATGIPVQIPGMLEATETAAETTQA